MIPIIRTFISYLKIAIFRHGTAIFALTMLLFFAMLLISKLRGKDVRLRRRFLLAFAFAVILHFTILGRSVKPDLRCFRWELFWSYRVTGAVRLEMIAVNLCNILMFLPMGIALPLNMPARAKNCGKPIAFVPVVTALFLISFSIEIVQGYTGMGICEADDIFHNTLGGILGYGIYLIYYFQREAFHGIVKNTIRKIQGRQHS